MSYAIVYSSRTGNTEQLAQAVREGRVLQVTVQGLDFRRKCSILYHREKHFTAAAGAFVRLCREGVPEIPPEAAGGLY